MEKEKINKLFVVIVKYLVDLKIIEQLLQAHIDFLDRYYGEDVFITSGPQEPWEGGIILAQSSEKEMLWKILREDPFYQHQAAEYSVYEFKPTKYNSNFSMLKKFIS